MTPDERYKNAIIYGTSHPEIYMTKADELWEKYSDVMPGQGGLMGYAQFLAAIKEYGEAVKKRDAEICVEVHNNNGTALDCCREIRREGA